jgi:4-hydroxy-2-oxoglutarate aldolase
VRLFDLAQAGRHEDARVLQRQLTPLSRAVTSQHGVAGLKAAMALVGFAGGEPRAPLVPAPPAAIEELRRLLAEVEAPASTQG